MFTISEVLVVFSLIVIGCGKPEPPELAGFEPSSISVQANESIDISLKYTEKDAKITAFSWTAEAGKISGGDKVSITYQAPKVAGEYKISVKVSYEDADQPISLDGTVKVLPPPPPPEKAIAEKEKLPTTAKAPTTPAPPVPEVAKKVPVIQKILKEGGFTVAVQTDFKPFSFTDKNKQRVGFDVDMMREFARRWLGDEKTLTILPVLSSHRIPTLIEGKADIIAAALTNTPERQKQIDYSYTYFKDGQRLLVQEGSEITNACDLKGKKIAVIKGSTGVQNIQTKATECGFDADLVYFEAHENAVDAVLNGDVGAFTTDGLALSHFAEGKPLKVVGNHFSEEPYGLGIAKGDDQFQKLVNLTLVEMYADGTFDAIYYKWFKDKIASYPIPTAAKAQMDPEITKLATTDLPPLFASKPETPPVKDYTVVPGDTLSTIAGKFYGDVSPASWKRIYDANREVIGDNPSRLKIGMRLIIPES